MTYGTGEKTLLSFTGLLERIQLKRRHTGQGAGREAELLCPGPVPYPPSALMLSPPWKLSKTPCPRVFLELNLQPPLLSPELSGWGWGRSLGLSGDQSHPEALSRSHPITR